MILIYIYIQLKYVNVCSLLLVIVVVVVLLLLLLPFFFFFSSFFVSLETKWL